MLEHQKLILKRTSDNKELFRKELMKSIKWLKSYEVYKLHSWVKNNYWDTHRDIIREVFDLIVA